MPYVYKPEGPPPHRGPGPVLLAIGFAAVGFYAGDNRDTIAATLSNLSDSFRSHAIAAPATPQRPQGPNLRPTGTIMPSAPSAAETPDASAPSPSATPRKPVIMLDPGHAGSNVKVTDKRSGLLDSESSQSPEKERVFRVAQTVQTLLGDSYEVYLTKKSATDNIIARPGENAQAVADKTGTGILRARVDKAAEKRADLFVSIHTDEGQEPTFNDVYDIRKGLWRGAGSNKLSVDESDQPIVDMSLKCATAIAEARTKAQGRPTKLAVNTSFSARGLSPGNIPLVMLWATKEKIPSVYNETGKKVDESAYARGIADGIRNCLPPLITP